MTATPGSILVTTPTGDGIDHISPGTATQVLTSNGPGVEPSFQAAGGSGSVTIGAVALQAEDQTSTFGSAFAFEGITFTAAQTFNITAIWGKRDTLSGDILQGALCQLSNATSSATLTSVALTPSFTAPFAQTRSWQVIKLTTPVTVTAGTTWAVMFGNITTGSSDVHLYQGSSNLIIKAPVNPVFFSGVSTGLPTVGATVNTVGSLAPLSCTGFNWNF